jgi:hypothetical protein
MGIKDPTNLICDLNKYEIYEIYINTFQHQVYTHHILEKKSALHLKSMPN